MSLKTKAELVTEIATFTDGGENTVAKFRAFATDLLDSVGINIAYADDTVSSTHRVTKRTGLTLITYFIITWRTGNTIHFSGNLVVDSTATARILADITNSDFQVARDINIPISGQNTVILKIGDDGVIETTASLTAGIYSFNGSAPAAN